MNGRRGRWDSASVELESLYESRGQAEDGVLDRGRACGRGRIGLDWVEKDVQGGGKGQGKVLRTFEGIQE